MFVLVVYSLSCIIFLLVCFTIKVINISFITEHTLFIFKFIYLFIFGCVGSSLLCVGFLWLRWVGATLCCSAWASHCSGVSCCRAWALGVRASVVAARGLSSCGSRAPEHRLSSCGTWA